jgi:hypothetical protein
MCRISYIVKIGKVAYKRVDDEKGVQRFFIQNNELKCFQQVKPNRSIKRIIQIEIDRRNGNLGEEKRNG